jgi:hypothetical protein
MQAADLGELDHVSSIRRLDRACLRGVLGEGNEDEDDAEGGRGRALRYVAAILGGT